MDGLKLMLIMYLASIAAMFVAILFFAKTEKSKQENSNSEILLLKAKIDSIRSRYVSLSELSENSFKYLEKRTDPIPKMEKDITRLEKYVEANFTDITDFGSRLSLIEKKSKPKRKRTKKSR